MYMTEYRGTEMNVGGLHGPFYDTAHVLILPLWGLGNGPSPKARVSVFRGYLQTSST
jgi:hypothetical protein